MATSALGHFAAMTLVISFTVQAFTLKRSSRDMPGLRGVPAGKLIDPAMGTHVLTGFVMTAIMALGHFVAMTLTMSLIIPALTLKRSSRVMPGLRGTPAAVIVLSRIGSTGLRNVATTLWLPIH
uniref:Uncharacterized protein n=1 Tax=Glossina pallidipes TaxID=7398 RepID=A0A1B0AIQ4_GLOPL